MISEPHAKGPRGMIGPPMPPTTSHTSWNRVAFIVGVLILMVLAAWLAPDRSVRLAGILVRERRLLSLSTQEQNNLTAFLEALGTAAHLTKSFSVNEPYAADKINVYVIGSSPDGYVSHGNAGYSGRSDILFIDSYYFLFGDQRVFDNSEDALVKGVLTPLRVHAYFVIAHEIGHRQLHRWMWQLWLPGAPYAQAREVEADDFAINMLKALYGDEALRRAAAIPEPVSLLNMSGGDPTALQRLADHMGYSIAFQSEGLFDAPFPILSKSSSHPAFFARMHNLLERLVSEANKAHDEEALQKLNLAVSVSSATAYLLTLNPTEIEFDHPFQFAFVDDQAIYVVADNGQTPLVLPIEGLPPEQMIRQHIAMSQNVDTIRYAWPGHPGEAVILRRDARIDVIHIETGRIKSTRPLALNELGDSSCVKKIILPPQPANTVYACSCTAQVEHVALIDREGDTTDVNLRDVARKALVKLGEPGDPSDSIDIARFDLNANGMPTLTFTSAGAVFSSTLSTSLSVITSERLSIDSRQLPEAYNIHGARLARQLLIADGLGRPYLLHGSDLLREYSLYDVRTQPATLVSNIDLTPSTHEPRLATDVYVRDTHQLSGNRLIVNLESGGVYLINFEKRIITPLSREEFSHGEQVLSNSRGDWILFRKYGARIVLFRGEEKP